IHFLLAHCLKGSAVECYSTSIAALRYLGAVVQVAERYVCCTGLAVTQVFYLHLVARAITRYLLEQLRSASHFYIVDSCYHVTILQTCFFSATFTHFLQVYSAQCVKAFLFGKSCINL